MFSILTVLAVIIADVHGQFFMSQDEECTATIPGIKKTTTVLMCDPEVMLAFLVINEGWIDGPIWNDRLASKALKEALKQKKINADYKIRQEKVFLKGERDKTTLVQKVTKALSRASPYWKEEIEEKSGKRERNKQVFIRRIPPAVYYGCNGILDTERDKDILTVVCLYRTSLKKPSLFYKYKNIEVKGAH